MKRIISLLGILLVAAILFSCAPEVTTVRETSPVETKEITPVSQWDKVLAAARKEGKVVIYNAGQAPSVRAALSEGFSRRTGILVEMVAGRGGEISAKLVSENRYGLFLADVYLGGTTTMVTELKPKGLLSPMEPVLFLPEVMNAKLWFKNVVPWLDKDRMIIQTRMMPGGFPDVVFNTNLTRKSELVSWYDLLNPKFKASMNMQDPTTAGRGGKLIINALTYYGLDWDYLRALARQEPTIVRDERLIVEWVARGKHMVSIMPDPVTYAEYKAAGAPVESSKFKETMEPLGGGSSAIVLIDRAPHPNAASLFINWFLSKEGQTVFARAYEIQSAREDVPTGHLLPENIRKPGIDYAIQTEEYILDEAKVRPITLEVFGPLLR